jgi:hypothetical protein
VFLVLNRNDPGHSFRVPQDGIVDVSFLGSLALQSLHSSCNLGKQCFFV